MKKIVIIGSAGSGKSTLARRLGQMLDIEVIHLDTHYWKPGWAEPSGDEWRHRVEQLVRREAWIMDGNYSGTLDIRLAAADTVIFLDFPRLLCLWRVLKRWWRYRGRSRPDLPPGCPEKIDLPFLRWIWQYPRTRRPLIRKKLKRASGEKRVIVLSNPRDVRRFLREVETNPVDSGITADSADSPARG
jgi:adenylate kinase family enzyme